jgi:hypothetical protein
MTRVSAPTLQHLLFAVVVLEFLGIACGFGVVLSGVGASAAAPRSLACLSRATGWIITGVTWGNESWTRPNSVGFGTTSAAPELLRRLLACSEQLTTTNTIKGWSRPLLPDHAELAASEQAQHFAARARRSGKPIRQALIARFDKVTHPGRRRRPAAPGRLGHHRLAAAAPADLGPHPFGVQCLGRPTASGLHLRNGPATAHHGPHVSSAHCLRAPLWRRKKSPMRELLHRPLHGRHSAKGSSV